MITGEVVHEAVFRDLLTQFGGDRSVVRRLVDDFVSLWGDRMLRLTKAIARPDPYDAATVLRSIRSTSTMLGAQELAQAATRAFDDVQAGRETDLEPIRLAGARTCVRLQELVAA